MQNKIASRSIEKVNTRRASGPATKAPSQRLPNAETFSVYTVEIEQIKKLKDAQPP